MLSPASLEIPVDHPSFAGHFPGAPLLPGVVLIDELVYRAQRAGWLAPEGHCRLIAVKFVAPVEPGDVLELAWEATTTAVRFTVRSSRGVVAQGALQPVAPLVEPAHAEPAR